MLEILYRIYRTLSQEEREELLKKGAEDELKYYSWSNVFSEEICMECFICETRDAFKDHIRSIYGADIKFANSKKYPPNTYYCIIIGEHCYNGEKYFNRIEYECDYCHSVVKGSIDCRFTFGDWEITNDLANQFDKYSNKKFCCHKCRDRYKAQEMALIRQNADYDESWVSRDNFVNHTIAGYIYKITKKSTGEFYIGQTVYAPIFRWGQHLKTERFDIKNILDYKFETIEIVPRSENILEREKYWIQKYYKENPSLSLNIMQTANIE